MELSYVINSQIGKSLKSATRTGSIAAGTQSGKLLDTTLPTVLEYLEFATNSYNTVRLVIINKETGLSAFNAVSRDGASILTSIRPDNIINGIAFMDIIEHNETLNLYKYRFNLRGIIFPKGVDIYIENTGSTDKNGAGFCVYRTL